MRKIALINRFKVYSELAEGIAEAGAEALPYGTAEELHSLLEHTGCRAVLDINFHPDIWEECVRVGVDYTVWSFDSDISGVLQNIDHHRLRVNDRFFLFNEEDCRRARPYHSQVYYLPFSAGPGLVRTPRRNGFCYDVAFVMNSYDETRRQAQREYQEQLAQSGTTRKKMLQLTHELGETAIQRHLPIFNTNCMEQLWRELTAACGIDPFEGKPEACHRFCRGLGQLLSTLQRETCLRTLGDAGFNVAVFGDDYWQSITPGYANMTFFGSADYRMLPQIYNTAKVNINLTQAQNIESIPQRIFHLLAAGGFVLTNGADTLTRLFVPGRHLQIFSGREQLAEQVQYYLSHERERIKIAERGHEEFLARHQIKDRINAIFEQQPPQML